MTLSGRRKLELTLSPVVSRLSSLHAASIALADIYDGLMDRLSPPA